MKIAIIGNGNVGSGLANILSKTQHEVGTFGRADDVAKAVTEADIVIFATPYGAAAEIADQADFTGKIVIDVSNPVTEDFSALQLGTTTSAAEAIAALVPGAFVVKAFNTIFAQHYAGDLKLDGQPLQTFIAADDETARETVKTLAAEAGFEPVDAGSLSTARQLEPLGFLNIQFGYVLGKGTEIAPRWQFSA
ncbi:MULTISPECIES: NADPH-dependent F420 reductase [Rhodobacterales]|jgi:predicted dinucleotide-binding enzyme|uniref:NADPH-dependent F420 reductase n=1 Tax=Rhodobacterales TaxID=204455 RepID=UPI00260C2C32|nr:NAD(P)-binding domain-containing protein [Pseudooceanicola sp.]MDF1856784.1 NAD(P)-binding domain-containing protein [Pseudooceanicola sp.]